MPHLASEGLRSCEMSSCRLGMWLVLVAEESSLDWLRFTLGKDCASSATFQKEAQKALVAVEPPFSARV